MRGDLAVTGRSEADDLVNTKPMALLIAMLLDQQIPLEWAFAGPAKLCDRLGHLDAATIAAMPCDDLVAVATTKPAIHRYPAVMGKRIHGLCIAITERYDNDAARIWDDDPTAAQLVERLAALPGYGDEKIKILIAILAKRFGIRPDGWQQAAGAFADDQPRSAADIYDEASHRAVRQWKAAQRAANLDKQDRPVSSGRHHHRI